MVITEQTMLITPMKYWNRTMVNLLMENNFFVETKYASLAIKKLTFIDIVSKNILLMYASKV